MRMSARLPPVVILYLKPAPFSSNDAEPGRWDLQHRRTDWPPPFRSDWVVERDKGRHRRPSATDALKHKRSLLALRSVRSAGETAMFRVRSTNSERATSDAL